MNYIFIDSKEDTKKLGIVEDDKLVEYFMDDKEDEKMQSLYKITTQEK